MSKWFKSSIFLIVLFSLFWGLTGCIQTPDLGDNVSVTFIVKENDVEVIHETFTVQENTSVYALIEREFEATYTLYGEAHFMDSITFGEVSVTPTGNSYIAFYINDEYATVGIDDYFIQAGDILTFQVESW